MESWHLVWVLTAVVGLVAAGGAGSGFALVAGERPQLEMLHKVDELTPVRVLALVVYAPMALTRSGFEYLGQNPLFGGAVAALGLGWSFMQGVFILSTFFGYN